MLTPSKVLSIRCAAGSRTCAAIGRREDGPDALDRVEHGDVGHLVTAAQQGLAAPDMRIEPLQLVIAEVLKE